MKKLLILLILLFGSTACAFNPFIVFSGVPASSGGECTGSYCQGISTTCADDVNYPDNGNDGDFTWANKWTADESGTVTYVSVRTGDAAPSTPVDPIIFVFNGDTLIGTGNAATITEADTKYRIPITVEEGQTLDFSSTNVITFGYSINTGSGRSEIDYLGVGSGGTAYLYTKYYTYTVPSTWLNYSTLVMSLQLEYCK